MTQEPSSEEAFATSADAESAAVDNEETSREGRGSDEEKPDPPPDPPILGVGAILGIAAGGMTLFGTCVAVAFFVGTCHRTRRRNEEDKMGRITDAGGSYVELFTVCALRH